MFIMLLNFSNRQINVQNQKRVDLLIQGHLTACQLKKNFRCNRPEHRSTGRSINLLAMYLPF